MRWSILVLALFIPLVTAQPGCGEYCDYEEGDWDMEGQCVHAVDYSKGSDQIVYEYAYVCNGEVRAIEYIFNTREQPEFFMEAAMVSGGQSSVFALEMGLQIIALVQFEDTDGDRAFNPNVDDMVAEDDFSEGSWKPIQASDAGRGVRYSADYEIGFGGTFRIVAQATGESYRAGASKVNPTDTKIDFEFHDVPYVSETSRLAIVLGVGSEVASVKGGTPRGVQSSEEGFAIGGQQSAYFAWAKTADVDGKPRPVDSYEELESESASQSGGGSSVQAAEVHGGITLAYARGNDIVHDPRLGVAFSQGGKNSPVPVWFVVPALVGVAVLRRRLD